MVDVYGRTRTDIGFAQALDSFRESQKKERAKEARELEKTQAYETKKLEEINKKLQDANDIQRRTLQSDKAQIEAAQADRKERKDNRSEARKALDNQKGALEEFKKELEGQGRVAADNKEFTKKSVEIQKRELKLRMDEARGNPSARKEIRDEQRAITKKHGNLLQKMALGITGMKDSMKAAVKTKVRGLWSIIKGTIFGAFLIALIAFMQSKYWDMAKEKIVDFAVWLKENLWPGLKEWVIKLKEINIEGLTNSFKNLALVFGAILGALAIGKLFGLAMTFGLPGALLVGTTIASAVAIWMHKDEISNALTNLSNAFEKMGINLNEMEIAALGIITSLGLLALAKKGITRAIMGGLAALGIGTLLAPKDVPKTKTKYKHGQVLKHGTGRVVFDERMMGGGGFKEYTGDVKAGKIVQTGKGGEFPKMHGSDKTGVGKLVKGGLSAVEKGGPPGILGKIKSVTSLARHVPLIGHVIGAGLGGLAISSYLNAEGDKEKAMLNLTGEMGSVIGAFALPAIIAAIGFAMGFNPLSLIGGILAGTFGAIGGKAVHQGLAQFMYDMPITAFPDKLNKALNLAIAGKSGTEEYLKLAGEVGETRASPAALKPGQIGERTLALLEKSRDAMFAMGTTSGLPGGIEAMGEGPSPISPLTIPTLPINPAAKIVQPRMVRGAPMLRTSPRALPLLPGSNMKFIPHEDLRSSLIQLQKIARDTEIMATQGFNGGNAPVVAAVNNSQVTATHFHRDSMHDPDVYRYGVNTSRIG